MEPFELDDGAGLEAIMAAVRDRHVSVFGGSSGPSGHYPFNAAVADLLLNCGGSLGIQIAELGSGLAGQLMYDGFSCLHCEAFGQRRNPSRSLVPGEPTRKKRANLLRGVVPVVAALITKAPLWKTKYKTYDPYLILDWLDYCGDLKNNAKGERSAAKLTKILGRSEERTPEEMMRDLQQVGATTLRRSMSRADVVAMILHRLLMAFYRTESLISGIEPDFFCSVTPRPAKEA